MGRCGDGNADRSPLRNVRLGALGLRQGVGLLGIGVGAVLLRLRVAGAGMPQ